MKKEKIKVVYEKEDDVLNVWLSNKPFDYAEDNDLVITHYTKEGEPVYIEILYASRFLKKNRKITTPSIVAHRIK